MSEHPNLAAALVAALSDLTVVEKGRKAFNPYADRGRPLAERLRNRYIEVPSGCWIWLSTVNTTGYAMVKVDGRHRVAHRVVYEFHKGPIPDGLVLDHLCMVKACVNPAHLEPVTQAENVRRCNEALGLKQYATHCPNGHDLNVHAMDTGEGYRRCRLCTAETNRARYLRKKAAA